MLTFPRLDRLRAVLDHDTTKPEFERDLIVAWKCTLVEKAAALKLLADADHAIFGAKKAAALHCRAKDAKAAALLSMVHANAWCA